MQQLTAGPKKLSLPAKSTDADLRRVLGSGQFGGLECLSLAFTSVSNESVPALGALVNLRYLNLWATRITDDGLAQLAEHLLQLQVLNLCECRVTDKALLALARALTFLP